MTFPVPDFLKTSWGKAAAGAIALVVLLAGGVAAFTLFGGSQDSAVRQTFVTETGGVSEAGRRYAEHHREMESLSNATPQLRQNILRTLARIAKDGGPHERDPDRAQDYLNLSWQALLAGEYQVALDAADHAASFAGDVSGEYALDVAYDAQLHRAHALMFLGKRDEAFTIYLRYKDHVAGSEVPEYIFTWNDALAADFLSFREAGISNPLMSDVEKALALR